MSDLASTITCRHCRVQFVPQKLSARYCSVDCKNAAWTDRRAAEYANPGDDGAMPPDIEYREMPPMKHMYTATCSQCAEAKNLLLTDQEARALRPIKCERCGARVFVTLADRGLGSLLDPERPMPMQRYGGRTVRVVPQEDIVA